MNMRSTRSTVTFCHPFTLKGRSEILPAGAYEVLVEEEELQGVSFLAYRKTATYLIVMRRGKTEMREISGEDLAAVLSLDQLAFQDN
ncbi:hypothetical protein B0E33_20545 [Roseibium algicola]|jgi:hypothetical protein|uniref:Uncharacterized protein n=1 Tax=Roseibium algicola TaxID=2857014 RepID=A0ABM6I5H3_9HYPH|nr:MULTISPECIES: hypothetical protein [Stappiaceae]AQQ05659.1 hypothetical protein B0E33_20545 [Roseibium aggregatum]MCR9284821.1 hypothetical protein [Paracoccaceae bacterium]NKX65561.1 hypothetical protein [Labrenzia sp. 5N]WJS05836.1 hypothetical protein QUB73_27845 [Roseibium aggregatum]